jgi:hypothetical protein
MQENTTTFYFSNDVTVTVETVTEGEALPEEVTAAAQEIVMATVGNPAEWNAVDIDIEGDTA